MKSKILILISSVLIVVFCLIIGFSRWQHLKSTRPEFLVNGNWQTADDDKISIDFKKDGKFYAASESGNGMGDLKGFNKYSYNRRFDRIELSGERADVFLEILYRDKHSLCLKLKNGVLIFKNHDEPIEADIADSVKKHIDTDKSVSLSFLANKADRVLVAPYNYDRDAKDSFAEYLTELKLADNVKMTSVSVRIENGREDVSVFELGQDDRKNIGEYYTSGFLLFDDLGYVKEVVFYGSTVVC